jgi:hypothetical protein
LQRKRSGSIATGALEKYFPKLADLGAQKSAVIFDSDLTAAEQVGHGGNGFTAAFRAGTNGEDQITKGKLC